ncbi:MAG: sugar phosphate nucleotidyltransferase [Armatimonadota bacterium]|nr:sugar phosphate nucleotidyltransferase [Armatimonadota bacterium]MDR7402348.1 sugar phosphate nucleotidyltransferase [Armatimonadota bacterium]MDR7404293.1 sugar phosphate nucleotidyltransferase [Armatimonadota bacterium]MDR7437333.1 sugar phosphate nucleotidyltransferase [Armatimonadota bacterium]MDR7472672.1 sugar phosphate nucleotidyltransferase [Armatimonadota bacterium]
MKAIIPAAGMGTRLRPHTFTQPKALLPVAGRPILAHIVDELSACGVDEVILVLGYLGERVIDFARRRYPHLTVRAVWQEQPLGNGHAVYVAREYLDGTPAVIIFGDTIVKGDLAALVRGPHSLAGVKEVADPRRLGVVEVDREGLIRRIVEKPEVPPSRLAVIGVYYITDTLALREALERLVAEDRRQRGEFWLADGLQLMLDRGVPMRPFAVERWYDCGTVEAWLQANRDLLALDPPPVPEGLGGTVIPPSYVSSSATLEGSVVGPHACVGDEVRVVHSTVRDSILLPRAVVEDAHLTASVVGEGAAVRGVRGRVNIGDASRVEGASGEAGGAGRDPMPP